MGGEDRELARLLQEAGANALGPVVTQMAGGWRLRAAGGRRLYLQVESDNPAATALLRRAGFRHAHTYHYRVAPPAQGGERE